MIGSKEELVSKATEKLDINTLDLHRPYMDEIHIKCPDCGKEMLRVKEVIDCWFDSGAMPFAQYHYPFENKELWESQYPADFIAEGIDQTRGWFYSLLVIGVFMTGKSPYKNVLVNELLLDKNGQKMHKSKGNVVEPFSTIEKYGADAVRWYLAYVSPTWTPLKFDEEGLKEVHSKFFNPFKNTYSFFQTYANIDKIDIKECFVPVKDREDIDKWRLSKYNKLVKEVTKEMDNFDLNAVVKLITTFVSDDLSNWYIRRNRDRFWGSELDNSKKSVYMTTYEVLTGVCKLAAPIIPYTTEEIYTKLTFEESVHLRDYPVCDEKLIDEKLEEKMDLVRDIISLGRAAREDVKIKVKQPLKEVLLDGKDKKVIGNLDKLIKEELNVKEIVFVDDLKDYMNFTVKPNFKNAGPLLGSKIKDFSNFLSNLSEEDILKIRNGETINFEDKEIDNSLVDIVINSKEGFNVSVLNNKFVILNTTLTEDLINEGIARELVSKIQNLRKQKEFNVADRINTYYNGDEKLEKVLKDFEKYIKNETLTIEFIKKEDLKDKLEINDIECYLDVERINN
jgi:isoleucyl-tRNA synthetase